MIRRIVSFAVVGALVALMTVATFVNVEPVSADGETIQGDTEYSGIINTPVEVNTQQIVGNASDVVPVRLFVSHGSLEMSTITGLTFSGDTTGSLLEFSGTVSNVNAALATLTYTRTSMGSDTLEVSLVEPGEVFFPDNGHLYKYVSSGSIDWTNAQTAAASQTEYGAAGYLTTITSQAENDFVSDRLLGAGWMGASDSGSEGDWKWLTGPEQNMSFWSGAVGGSPVSGRYNNWADGEPNDFNFGEDCGQFLAGGTGEWNDLPCSDHFLAGYVVEYGAEGELPQVASHEATISTLQQPELDSPNSNTSANTINLDFTLHSTPASGTLTLTFYGANAHSVTLVDLAAGHHTFSLDPANVLTSSNVASVSPNGTIPDDIYTVRLSYDDAATGHSLSQEVDDFTIDTTGPEVTMLTPLDGATGVAVDSNLTIQFNEPVEKGSGNITISYQGSGGTFETIPVNTSLVTGEGTDTITINPSVNLDPGADYYISNLNGVFVDELGNSEHTSSWQFTTLEAPVMLCEQPLATQTTVTTSCTSSPGGWGETTWEARYKKHTDSSYTAIMNVNVDEDDAASVLLTGLNPETDYDVQFRFTNDFGTSEWGTVEVKTNDDPDNDDDGRSDAAEDAGPNDGDANDDGMPDRDQAYVASFISEVTNKFVVLEVSDDCTVMSTAMTAVDNDASASDTLYSYPAGMMEFLIDCGMPGYIADVTQYYYDLAGDFVARKYNPSSREYSTIDSASINDVVISGFSVKSVSYRVTDGGPLDMDSSMNGRIDDPAGLGVLKGSTRLADTGKDQAIGTALGVLFIVASSVFVFRDIRNKKALNWW